MQERKVKKVGGKASDVGSAPQAPDLRAITSLYSTPCDSAYSERIFRRNRKGPSRWYVSAKKLVARGYLICLIPVNIIYKRI
jgi:hypothetical protein